MAETYLKLTQQIEELKQKAEAVRAQEIAGVIDRIRVAIHAYGLTSAQLFGVADKAPPARRSGGKPGGKGSAERFRDADGHSWSGRGPRPGWVKAALAAGKALEDFKVADDAAVADAGPRTRKRAGRGSAAKGVVAPKYKDDAGHTWSGRGPRPGWFKAAIDAGKTPDDLAAHKA